MRGLVANILVLLLAGSAMAQDGEKVKGRVVDQAGNPVMGAEVASMWGAGGERGEGAGKQTGFGSVTTDAEGRFTARVSFYEGGAALMAIDAGQKLGGMTIVPVADAKKDWLMIPERCGVVGRPVSPGNRRSPA